MEIRTHPVPNQPDLADWSEEQTRLIRKALWSYKRRIVEGRTELSWIGVQADVKDITGVDMGGKDTLRQFAHGRRVPLLTSRRRAIAEFLTHPDVNCLSLNEFLVPNSPYHAPIRLLEYLNADTNPVDQDSPLHCVCGNYVANRSIGDSAFLVVILRLSKHSDSSILQVTEKYMSYRVVRVGDRSRPKAEAQLTKESIGWCILTPEDNLLIFLKDKTYGDNHYYHLISDTNIWTRNIPKRVVLLRFDYPHLIDTSTGNLDEVSENSIDMFRKDVLTFHRDSPINSDNT